MLGLIEHMIERAIDYLIDIQNSDGSWTDYCLPVGTSDQWVTAYTALGMLYASRMTNNEKGISSACHAVQFLKEFQTYKAGWGYNRNTGVDADTTAHVIRLFRDLNIEVRSEDEECLMQHYNHNGGFSTYCNKSNWGKPHPDVTAAASLALENDRLQSIKPELLNYCDSIRLHDGSWPTYWWRNNLYGTYYMLELYDRLDAPIFLIAQNIKINIHSCFDFAWALGVLNILKQNTYPYDKAFQSLFDMQENSGAWNGSPSLRVTDPACPKPWISPQGEYYTDHMGTITTSSVIRVLSKFL